MTNGTHNSDWQRFPQSSLVDDNDFEDDAALEKRRIERLKNKRTKQRKQPDMIEEGDPDRLLEQPKSSKKRPKRKQESALWQDDRYDDEEDFTMPSRRRRGHNDETWIEDIDE